MNGVGSGAGGVVSPDLLTANTPFNPKFKGTNEDFQLNWGADGHELAEGDGRCRLFVQLPVHAAELYRLDA